MNRMLNSLPSRTWNRLGINETFADIEEIDHNHTPAAEWEGTNAVFCACEKDDSTIPAPVSGMGSAMADFTKKADRVQVRTPEGVSTREPVVLRYAYAADERAISRLHLHAEKDSTLDVVLLMTSAEGVPEKAGVAALSTEITAEEGSHIRFYVIQLLDDAFTCLCDIGGVCEKNAVVDLVKLELGAGTVYTGSYMDLLGKRSAFHADVGYYVKEKRHLDMNYVAMHHGPKTESRMDVSGTLEENAKKTFRGTIDFQRGCPGAVGGETENVLLFGDRMVNQSIPLILCKEEDVEGNHGASIGKLDEKVLFYLASRGIDEKEAQKMIAQARIEAICAKIPNEEIRSLVHNFEI